MIQVVLREVSGMRLKDLSPNKITASALLDRLSEEGWSSTHDSLAQELVQRLASKLETHAVIRECAENRLYFILHLTDIHLRTMHEVPCLLLGGEADVSNALSDFWKRHNTPQFIPFILTLSASSYEQAINHLSNGRCFILSPEQIRVLLNANDAQQQLKQFLFQQVPRRTLIPYNIFQPAEGAMFFGREEELDRLEEEDATSFSIAGPGRVGKTSLLENYRQRMLRSHNQRVLRIKVSFYKSDPNPDAAARFLALEIWNSKLSNRMTASGLVNFLRYMRSVHGKPLELLLDEVDEVCQGEAFKYLGEAARMGLCRLVLLGKGVLLKMMLSARSPLDCRLELLRLGPLTDSAAHHLLLKPLTDLGFQISNADRLLGEILLFTGRLPHLLQLFGKKLAEFAIKEGTETIGWDLLEQLRGDFLITQYFIKSLNDLENPEARLLGLTLVEEGQENISIAHVQEAARRKGLHLDSQRVMEICIDLVINNVLVWNNGSYRLANEGLPFYARQTGYLSSALSEAQAAVNALN
jgi:hypothetical protein